MQALRVANIGLPLRKRNASIHELRDEGCARAFGCLIDGICRNKFVYTFPGTPGCPERVGMPAQVDAEVRYHDGIVGVELDQTA